MRIRLSVPEDVPPEVLKPVLDATLEAVTRLDEHMITTGQSPTSRQLVEQGARWKPEPPGDEHFDHGATIAQRGDGDCDDWGPLHAATMRATGEDPRARAVVIPSGPSTWHAVVQKGDGRILTGKDDISVMAGMPPPKHTVVGGVDVMQVYACDPHDGRIYQGSLAPTVGPLSLHCGPQVAVRGIHVVGHGLLYEARCDMPLTGSPLVGVHMRHRRGHVVGAQLPYALSCTSHGPLPQHALHSAITGAIMCGDAAELVPSLDRYKLLAMQLGMQGHDANTVRETLEAMIHHDLDQAEAQTGVPGAAHAEQLKAELAAHGVHVQGYYVGGFDLFSSVGKIASGVVHLVSPVVNAVANVVKPITGLVPWGDIVHGVEAAVSVVPGLGTAVSDVIATAETAINAVDAILSGSPLKFALQAAYNYALASIPGAAAIRIVLDPHVSKLLDIAVSKSMPTSDELNRMLNGVPDQPKIGSVSPRSILASLAHILVGHLGMKNTSGKTTPKPSPILAATPRTPPVAARPAPKPPGVAHAAVHVDAPKPTPAPPPVAHMPGTPPPPPVIPSHVVTSPTGAQHWHCVPGGGGKWQCQWLSPGAVQGAYVAPPTGARRATPGPMMQHLQRIQQQRPPPPPARDGGAAAPPGAAPPGAPPGAAPAPAPDGGGGGGGGGNGSSPGATPDGGGGYYVPDLNAPVTDPGGFFAPPDASGNYVDPSAYVDPGAMQP